MLDTIQEMSDEKLMELYQIGDLYAFNVLYQRYEHKIYGYFHRFFPEERCADLLQETFLKVHRSRSRYKTSLPFSKWLFVIVCNLAKDEFKRLSRLKEYLDDGQLGDTRTFLVDPETPESIVEHNEFWERIRQAILDLPENDREAIIQSKYEGKSYPEIAEAMDITVGAVKQRAYRGLLTLREKLKDLVEPESKEKAKKSFSVMMIFKFQGIIKKVLMGGLEAMKISAKVKIVTIGVVAVLMLSGAGVVIWHYQQSTQEVSALSIIQAEQQKNLSPISKNPSIAKVAVNKNTNKLIDKQKEDAKESQSIAQTDSLKDGNSQETKESETKIGGTIDPKEKTLAFLAELEARIPVLEEEIRTGMARINSRGDEVMAVWQSGNLDPETVKWINEQNREIQKEWKDLYLNKIWAYISCKANLDEENFKKHPQHPLAKGGPFYELAQHLPFNVTPRDFDNANWR
jgi:RNA polymerase sigma-70 factor (ECF subfamily)